MPKQRVIVDTCIIIEAFRTKAWPRLCLHFDIETVEKCVEECSTGDPLEPGRTLVPAARLREDLAQCHAVSVADLLSLSELDGFPSIDDGELHLMAWLYANRPVDAALLLSTADRAAVRAAHVLKLLDQVQSLEALTKQAGMTRVQVAGGLREQFREQWIAEARTRIRLGVI